MDRPIIQFAVPSWPFVAVRLVRLSATLWYRIAQRGYSPTIGKNECIARHICAQDLVGEF
jgi:hypothetical protein